MRIRRGFGIDLGTTNSAVAIMNPSDTDVNIFVDKEQRSTVPSCVWMKDSGGPLVIGHRAFARRGSRPEPVVSIKRRMGTTLLTPLGRQDAPPDNAPERVLASLTEDQEGRGARFRAANARQEAQGGQGSGSPLLWTPEELSACIIQHMSHCIGEVLEAQSLDGEVHEAITGIVTIPAYFDMPQIEATKTAARLAGLELIDLLHEPTAAAVYYSWKHHIPDGIFMVFDLGGGTFDVSILRRTSGEFEVLGIAGDNFLGGDEFDRALAEWIRVKLREEGYALDLKVDSNFDDELIQRQLVRLAEVVKKELSENESHILRDHGSIHDQENEAVVIEMEITRDDFEGLIRETLYRTIPQCWNALARAFRRSGISLKDVQHVLLVGGSTNIPMVQDIVRDHFCTFDGAPAMSDEEMALILDNLDEDTRETARILLAQRERAACPKPYLDSPGTSVAMGAAIRAAAAGTTISDDEDTVQILFRNKSSTTYETLDMVGFVQPGPNADGRIFKTIQILASDGSVIETQDLKEGGHFRIRSLELGTGDITTFVVSVLDDQGEEVARVGRKVERATEDRDLGSVLSTAVLSKPISMEFVQSNRLMRGILLPEGCSLPANASFRFQINDQSGKIVFPLYQGARKIRAVTTEVDKKYVVGTPVEFEISCDEQMFISLVGVVSGKSFKVDVGPPPPPSPPSQEEFAEMILQFKEASAALKKELVDSFEKRLKALMDDYDNAAMARDEPKMISKFADMEGLVKTMKVSAPKLDPPWITVERAHAELLDIIHLGRNAFKLASMDDALVRAEQYHSSARTAFEAEEEEDYKDAFDRINALCDMVRNEISQKVKGPAVDEMEPEQRATLMLQTYKRQINALLLHAMLTGANAELQELRGLGKKLDAVGDVTPATARDVIQVCQSTHVVLERIQGKMKQGKKMSLDEGLLDGGSFQVSDHAAASFGKHKKFGL